MRLLSLLKDWVDVPPHLDQEVTGLTLDSRKIKSGQLFIAIKGAEADGRQYIANAIANGAVAILAEAKTPSESIYLENNVPVIPLHQLSEKLGFIAAKFYDYPSRKMRMIGVTGTSGKTSCTHFLAQALQLLEIPCGIIGTLGNGFYGALGEVGLTTPDAITLQETLHQLQEQGAKAIAMEVSSHSIQQGRINGIEFDLGIFTNLSQDHLDYHGDMETYAGVKRHFLADFPTNQLIINTDDAYGRKWVSELIEKKPIFAYGIKKFSDVPSVFADHIQLSLSGIKATIHSPWGKGTLNVPLIGAFNLSNVLAVFTALHSFDVSTHQILNVLAKINSVPGRMQTLGGDHQPLVVVDYAHKPDALLKVLQILRQVTKGRLICVFGCGGDRDKGKRPLMAKIAEEGADTVIVTNDNPRHESPEMILADILAGFKSKDGILVELDRAKAIEKSIQLAGASDCILIAGKGAEHYQQIGEDKLPFDDVETVRSALLSFS